MNSPYLAGLVNTRTTVYIDDIEFIDVANGLKHERMLESAPPVVQP